ncbi:MAG: hypothetical protein WA840_17665 [Caulobacteraceae bacterium]
MKLLSIERVFLAAAAFTFGTLGSLEWSKGDGPSVGFIRGDFMVTTSTASAGEASGHVRRASCTLVRFYIAKYSAPAAEAWAPSKGATDANIQTARRCITPQQTARVGHAADRVF